MARNKKKTSRQQAGEFVSGGDMDSSMFWFGDLNLWGAFPTVPTVYQKPRSQVFYMTRNWFERQVFIRQIILLRFALYNYGFRLTGQDKKSSAAVKDWMAGKWYGIPIKKIVAQFVRDAWMEWLI